MAWNGWFTYDGNEIINASRTEAYARWAGAGWFKGYFNNDVLPLWERETYRSPSLDGAPWYDRDVPESGDFYGFYPLNVEGIENSTRTALVTESVLDGGSVGRIRNTTRSVVFNGILVAGSDLAADYGMRWLKRALLGGVCEAGVACSGGDLCYLAGAPCLCDNEPGGDSVDDCVDPLQRTLRHLTFLQGPTVTSKRETTDGGAIWTVDFAGTAGTAFEFGPEVPVIAGFGDPTVDNIWVGPVSGLVDMEADIVDETACGTKVWEPVYDPTCMAFNPPPGPPSVPLGCYVPPVNWARRQFTIPKEYIPAWDDVVPVVQVHARNGKVSNLRLRFYADPYAIGDTSDDPCSYCGDIVLSYIPADNTLVFDAAEQVVYVIEPGGVRRRADSLVFATDGTPFEWPALTCGFGYIVTIDMEQTQEAAMPVVDLSLYPRAV